MKKLVILIACLAVASAAVAQTRVDPKALRSYADAAKNGYAIAVGSGSFDTACTDGGLGVVTVQGAAYLGGYAIGLPATVPLADRFTWDLGAIALFDAAELLAAGTRYELVLEAADNLGLSFDLAVGLVDDDDTRTVFEGNGPFVAVGGFAVYHAGSFAAQHKEGVDLLGGATGKYRFPDGIVPEVTIPLGTGGGTISGCLNGSGQLRILDPDNNQNWRDECEAHGWRPVEVGVGGGVDLSAFVGGAPINTCSYSCLGPTVTCVGADGLPVPDVTVENPVAISISGTGEQMDRWTSFVTTTGFNGGLNLLVLGGDPTEPSELYINGYAD
jgi:hypothetical protein